jgi:hypothetical protein
MGNKIDGISETTFFLPLRYIQLRKKKVAKKSLIVVLKKGCFFLFAKKMPKIYAMQVPVCSFF